MIYVFVMYRDTNTYTYVSPQFNKRQVVLLKVKTCRLMNCLKAWFIRLNLKRKSEWAIFNGKICTVSNHYMHKRSTNAFFIPYYGIWHLKNSKSELALLMQSRHKLKLKMKHKWNNNINIDHKWSEPLWNSVGGKTSKQYIFS